MYPGHERIIELCEEMADIEHMAAHLKPKLAAVPDKLYSSDSEYTESEDEGDVEPESSVSYVDMDEDF